jgi:hypothetical protein
MAMPRTDSIIRAVTCRTNFFRRKRFKHSTLRTFVRIDLYHTPLGVLQRKSRSGFPA